MISSLNIHHKTSGQEPYTQDNEAIISFRKELMS